MKLTRRAFVATAVAAPGVRAASWDPARLGVFCHLPLSEVGARKVLAAARQAGFGRVQIQFPWSKAESGFLKTLPGWMKSEGLEAEVLGAYVNCCAPENILMDCRREDFPQAIELAGALGSRALAAWTGGYGAGLMKSDPRNFTREAEDNICRFIEPHVKRLESARLALALETYITLTCPDAPSLARVLGRLPKSVAAVLDPPNLTPLPLYPRRDEALAEMLRLLRDRVGVVHLKDFKLAAGGAGYELPGPLKGEMDYRKYAEGILALPGSPPLVAEHISPEEYAATRRALLPVFEKAASKS